MNAHDIIINMSGYLKLNKITKIHENTTGNAGNATGNVGNAFPPPSLDLCCQMVKMGLALSAPSPIILMIKVINCKNPIIKFIQNQ